MCWYVYLFYGVFLLFLAERVETVSFYWKSIHVLSSNIEMFLANQRDTVSLYDIIVSSEIIYTLSHPLSTSHPSEYRVDDSDMGVVFLCLKCDTDIFIDCARFKQ